MLKPGKGDIKINVLITGDELVQLQRHTWSMVESFGLDRRIDRYKGKRPIGLYRWDFECLLEVLSMELDDPKDYPSKDTPDYQALENLYKRLKTEYDNHYD
jgi:hypothetical protein